MTILDYKIVCPSCGSPNEGHTNLDDDELVPTEGDVSICLRCANIALYVVAPDGTLSLRPPTFDEFEFYLGLEEVREARLNVLRMHG